jgi:sugar lactone lactonase YvrE
MLRSFFIAALVPLTLIAACGGDGDDGGSGGSAGEDGAAGDTGTGGSSGCAETGKGSLTIEVTGLPSGVEADATLDGPAGAEPVTSELMLDDLGGGTYTVSANRVTDDDPIVRTVYDPSIDIDSFCLKDAGNQTVTVSYTAIPSSNKLWTTNANGDHELVAFASELLGESGAPAASVTVDAPAGKDVAFDGDGNLWAMGPTVADPHLVRFAASSLGASGEKEADHAINITDIPCSPELRAMAFDSDGNLWVSTCGDQIVRLTPSNLASDSDVSPVVVLGGVTDNANLAFDSDGNLWVVTGTTISRYDAARLGASDGDPADLVLTVTNPDDTNALGPTDLAFDSAGDLWATDFGGNLVFEIASADLGGTGEQTVAAAVRVAIGVTALIDRPAFDESGGLWIGLGGSGVGRLSPAQLGVTTSAGDPTNPEVVITSADLGSVVRVGFFPAASDLPLFHGLP